MKLIHTRLWVVCFFCLGATKASGVVSTALDQIGLLAWQVKKSVIADHGILADTRINSLARSAQLAVGVAESDCVPVKGKPNTPIFPDWALAIATPDAIYVNQKLMASLPESVVWFALLHESVHIKYRDHCQLEVRSPLVWLVPAILGATGATYGVMAALDRLVGTGKSAALASILGIPIGSVAAFVAGTRSLLAYMRMAERRADTEAAHACACKRCLYEVAERRKGTLPRDGIATYLSADEIRAIADTTPTLCARHQEKHTASVA